ncbi:uncharacterized protein LOC132933322 [Metopolophium dirhodum]|uniref:uncharacterized protein LOC132933322 n=1 Tax=Metopolophium dirhodum TaxID=44670 RepID=UPI00299065CD|nr:uncharacterized protein LOC132933322 [Metopolophium dirhodum]
MSNLHSFCLDTYEEAKYKAKIAQESSDLSGTEHVLKDRKVRAKMIDSSPSPSPKKKAIKSPPDIFLNKSIVGKCESNDDSDLDPDYTIHIDTSPIFLNDDNDYNDNSPKRKSLSGTKISDSQPLKPQKKFLSHTQPTKASKSKNLFDTLLEIETSPQLQSTSKTAIPIKRKLFDDKLLKSNSYSKSKTAIEPTAIMSVAGRYY